MRPNERDRVHVRVSTSITRSNRCTRLMLGILSFCNSAKFNWNSNMYRHENGFWACKAKGKRRPKREREWRSHKVSPVSFSVEMATKLTFWDMFLEPKYTQLFAARSLQHIHIFYKEIYLCSHNNVQHSFHPLIEKNSVVVQVSSGQAKKSQPTNKRTSKDERTLYSLFVRNLFQ